MPMCGFQPRLAIASMRQPVRRTGFGVRRRRTPQSIPLRKRRGATHSNRGPRSAFGTKGLVGEEAAMTGAIPFDAPGVELGHHGDDCSSVSIVGNHGLGEP